MFISTFSLKLIGFATRQCDKPGFASSTGLRKSSDLENFEFSEYFFVFFSHVFGFMKRVTRLFMKTYENKVRLPWKEIS